MIEQIACYVMIAWSVYRVQHMLPNAAMIDKIGVSTLGGAAVWYLAELYTFGAVHDAPRVMLFAVTVWVLPPSLRCWLEKVNVPVPFRILLGMRK